MQNSCLLGSHSRMPTLLCIIIITLACIPCAWSVCPASAQYLLVSNNTCYAQCPWLTPNKYYSYLPTNTCELICPGSYYGFDDNKTCVSICPSSPTQSYYDTVSKRCVYTCPANYFGYLGAITASNQKCLSSK